MKCNFCNWQMRSPEKMRIARERKYKGTCPGVHTFAEKVDQDKRKEETEILIGKWIKNKGRPY